MPRTSTSAPAVFDPDYLMRDDDDDEHQPTGTNNNHHSPLHNNHQDEDEDEEDDDPVIKTLPIYYTPHYISSLALLQYPDRPPRPLTAHPLLPPSLRPDADPEPDPSRSKLIARYKPNSQHLQIEVPIERDPETWNEDDAKEFGKGVVGIGEKGVGGEGKGKGKGGRRKNPEQLEEERRRAEEEADKKRLDRMIFASSTVPDVTNYLVGVVKEDALHLTPVTQTFQLRPHLLYLDQLVINERRAKREAHRSKDEESDGEADVSDSELKAAQAKAVQVSVKQSAEGGSSAPGGKGPMGGGNGRAGADLFNPMRMMEGEAWIDLQHFHAETREASRAFEHMFVPEDKLDHELTSKTKPSEYLAGR